MKNTKIISAFPAVGKSWLFEQLKNSDKVVLDSDSSKFSWLSEGVRNPDFPNNYIQHIKENIGKADYIFVSSHKEIRAEMNYQNVSYTLVFPHESLIKEYIERFTNRGNDLKFIEFISNNWFHFIDDMKNENCLNKIQLLEGQYLSDVLLF
jgi:hypothetical protein